VRTAGEYCLSEDLASETKSAVPLVKSFPTLAFIFRLLRTTELLT